MKERNKTLINLSCLLLCSYSIDAKPYITSRCALADLRMYHQKYAIITYFSLNENLSLSNVNVLRI